MATLSYIGYVLALIGGILVVLFGLVGLLGSAFLIFSPLALLDKSVHSLVEIVLGVICIMGSRLVKNMTWAVILVILGFVAGGIGGTLVVLGALMGLLSKLLK